MKKLFAILFLLLLTPIIAVADVSDECSDGNAVCRCTTSSQSIDIPVSSTQQCIDECGRQDFNVTYTIVCADGTTIDQGNVGTGTDQEFTPKPPPALNIQIPGLKFTEATLDNGYLTINYIGDYIVAIYPFLISAGALIGVVFIMIAGLQWILARGDGGAIQKAKDRIEKAITGLVLLLFAYTIAYLVDPETTRFEMLKIKVVPFQELVIPPYGEDVDVVPRSIPPNTVPIVGPHLNIVTSEPFLHATALEHLNAAAEEFFATNELNIVIASATRDLRKQATLFYDFCLTNRTKSCTTLTCNPAAGSGVISGDSKGYTLLGPLANETDREVIIQTLTDNAQLGNCPHTSTIAVDAWCPKNQGRPEYSYNPDCQYALEQAMLKNGFCRIPREPWHFELKMYSVSRSCSSVPSRSYTNGNGATVRPTAGCETWDYKAERCLN